MSAARSTVLLAVLLALPAATARAQTPAPAAPPAAAEPAPATPPAAPPPALPPSPPPGTPSAVEAAPKPPTAAEAMPATRPVALPPIDVGVWLRAGFRFQKDTDPKSVADWSVNPSYFELHVGGKIHEKVSLTLNLNGSALGGTAGIEDAIVAFDFIDQFHLWIGQLLVMADRANTSGPFFMVPWNYPGLFFAGPTGTSPAVFATPGGELVAGRNLGGVGWGDINGGQFKYLVGIYDNGNVNTSPLFSGRLLLSLMEKEPGFWGNGSYFGDKNILSIGVGGQFQKNGSSTAAESKNFGEFNADLLAEFKLGGGSWITGEAAYYHYVVSDTAPNAAKDSLYVLGAWASPVVGVGNLQPMARFQWANLVEVVPGAETHSAINFEVGLAYLIKGPALRVVGTYGYTKIPDAMTGAGISANAIQIGAQGIFF